MKKLAVVLRRIVADWKYEYISGGSPSFGDMERAFEQIANAIDPPKGRKKEKKEKIFQPTRPKRLKK